jgi:biopolymer transport protein ExbD
MSFISEDDVKGSANNQFAPMIDFLFLMLVFFASLAVTRVTTRDTEINLVKVEPETSASISENAQREKHIITIAISNKGSYKWVTDIHDYIMDSPQKITEELTYQYEQGLIPLDKAKTHILLKIDKKAEWEPILKAIFAIRDTGFEVHPIYEPEEEENSIATM